MTTIIQRPSRSAPLDRLQHWLIGLEGFLALGAWGGAFGLVSGTLPLNESVQDLPFQSPVLGGVALAAIVAVPATLALVLTLRRHRLAADAHPLAGGALMAWIVLQVGFIGLVSPLQPFMFTLGAAIMFLGLANRRH